jgi:hypothetical protein
MSNTRRALFLAPVALLLATGATDCEYFETVTVPSSDTTPPDIYDAVWWDGVHKMIRGQTTDLTYHLASGEEVLAISSGKDAGGVKKVTMARSWSWTCCDYFGGEPTCSTSQTLASGKVATQPGGVGQQVSNGVWIEQDVKMPSPSSLCSAPDILTSWSFSWTTTAENFHGKTRTGPKRTAVWP